MMNNQQNQNNVGMMNNQQNQNNVGMMNDQQNKSENSVNDDKEVDIDECFAYNERENLMTGDNSMYCSHCKINNDEDSTLEANL